MGKNPIGNEIRILSKVRSGLKNKSKKSVIPFFHVSSKDESKMALSRVSKPSLRIRVRVNGREEGEGRGYRERGMREMEG